jgi:mono/diheme cytochrome c family protein
VADAVAAPAAKTSIVAAAGIWLAATIVVAARAVQTAPVAPTQSVLDGVFTDEQAKRGQEVYTANCAHCHGNSLQGGEEAPPLAGADFIKSWSGSTVGDLVERARRSMPEDDPGTLTRQQYTDVTTFILGSNRYPTGKTELPIETEKQKLIKVEPIK